MCVVVCVCVCVGGGGGGGGARKPALCLPLIFMSEKLNLKDLAFLYASSAWKSFPMNDPVSGNMK